MEKQPQPIKDTPLLSSVDAVSTSKSSKNALPSSNVTHVILSDSSFDTGLLIAFCKSKQECTFHPVFNLYLFLIYHLHMVLLFLL